MTIETTPEIPYEYRVHQFGAFLQEAYLVEEVWGLPETNPLHLTYQSVIEFKERLKGIHSEFNVVYFELLPEIESNPLPLEQEAWGLLSPIVEHFLVDFDQLLVTPESFFGDQATSSTLRTRCFDIIQQWNIISHAFKAKFKRDPARIPATEQTLQELIDSLTLIR